jgi:hypothetical protein
MGEATAHGRTPSGPLSKIRLEDSNVNSPSPDATVVSGETQRLESEYKRSPRVVQGFWSGYQRKEFMITVFRSFPKTTYTANPRKIVKNHQTIIFTADISRCYQLHFWN